MRKEVRPQCKDATIVEGTCSPRLVPLSGAAGAPDTPICGLGQGSEGFAGRPEATRLAEGLSCFSRGFTPSLASGYRVIEVELSGAECRCPQVPSMLCCLAAVFFPI